MVQDGDFVAIFNSIHRVMKAEKILKRMGYKILLIPAPRALHADCGLAIRYAECDRTEVEGALTENRLLPDEIHAKRGDKFETIPLPSSVEK